METTSLQFVSTVAHHSNMSDLTVRYAPLEYAFAAITIVMSMLSLMGAALIVYTFLRFKELRTTSRKLLVYLSLSDSLGALGHLLGAVAYLQVGRLSGKRDLLCQVPAAISIFADLSSFLWTGTLAVYLYLSTVWNLITLANRLVWAFHAISWAVPAVVMTVSLVYGVIGYNVALARHSGQPSWCGIDPGRADFAQWGYLSGQGWQLGVFCIAGSVFLLTSLYIRKENRRDRERMLGTGTDSVTAIQSANRKLRFVPAIFVLLRIWGTIQFLLTIYNPSHRNSTFAQVLLILQAFGDNSQGLANAILFCFCTRRVRRRLSRVFLYPPGRCACCVRKKTKLPEFQACFQKRLIEELSSCSEIVNINTSETAPILT